MSRHRLPSRLADVSRAEASRSHIRLPHREPTPLRRMGPRGAQRLTHDGWVDEHVGYAEPVREREPETVS